jgi:hypothetical protein
MTGSMNWLATALLACALASGTIACGDDDDHGHNHVDGGPDGGGAMAGRSGNGGMSGGGGTSGADAGPPPTMAECVEKSMDATMGAVSSECLACVCENGPREAVACNGTCWTLVNCFALACGDLDPESPAAIACAGEHCRPYIPEILPATALGPIIDPTCVAECVPSVPSDAGTDAATDMDGGD